MPMIYSKECFICHLAVKRSMTGKKGKKTRRREWGGKPRRENGFRSLLWEKSCHHAFDVGRGREIKISSGQSLVEQSAKAHLSDNDGG